MRFLHLTFDEKFIPFAQRTFETAHPGCNEYRVMARRRDARFVAPAPNVRFVSPWYCLSPQLARDLENADCLLVHYLNRWSARAIVRAPARVLTAWHGWGSDYYSLLAEYAERLYLPRTEAWLHEHALDRSPVATRLRAAARRAVERLLFPDWAERALERLDVVSMLPSEFELLRRTRPGLRARHHQLYYSSAEATFLPGPACMAGPDLLLGNSASPTNNHLDAFASLRRLDLGDRRLLVPLSYGNPAYADAVCHAGMAIFGHRFEPLREFLPPDEYARRIAGCGFVFMNHVRQEATGNVSIALLKGAKVFLRQENLLMPFYRGLGAVLHRFPDDDAALDPDLFTPLPAAAREANRRAVMSYWSNDTVVRQARALADFAAAA